MQFPRFQTPSVFLKEYFRNNPEQLQTYVNVAIKATKLAVVPLGAVLKHLIEIQGLDPKTEPGRRMRDSLQQAFTHTHTREYDTDFDFSWLNKKFEEARKYNGLYPVDLSKEEFKDLTDVSEFKSPPPFTAPAMRTITEAGVPVTIDQSPVQELADLLDVHPVNQIAPEPVEQARDVFTMDENWLKNYTNIHASKMELPAQVNSDKLKDSLKKLIEFAKAFEEENSVDPSKLMARTKELKSLKETLSQYGTPSRSLKKTGKIRRTPTGKMNAVKETPRKSPHDRLVKTTKKMVNRSGK